MSRASLHLSFLTAERQIITIKAKESNLFRYYFERWFRPGWPRRTRRRLQEPNIRNPLRPLLSALARPRAHRPKSAAGKMTTNAGNELNSPTSELDGAAGGGKGEVGDDNDIPH